MKWDRRGEQRGAHSLRHTHTHTHKHAYACCKSARAPRLEDLSQAIDQLQPEEKEEGGERRMSPAAAVQTFFEMARMENINTQSVCTDRSHGLHRPICLVAHTRVCDYMHMYYVFSSVCRFL